MLWVKQRLPEILTGLEAPAFEGGSAHVTRVDSVEGDAVINIRKQKKMVCVLIHAVFPH